MLWGVRVIVPPPGRSLVLDELHETLQGASKMKALGRSYIWWPGMDSAIEERVKPSNLTFSSCCPVASMGMAIRAMEPPAH